MSSFDPNSYGPVFEPLLTGDRDRSLATRTPNHALRDQLDELTVASAFGHEKVVDQSMAEACLAGIWLLHDFLDASHSISQALDTPEGSFWHGIMHRCEGDFSNAKYWFHCAGDHPVFEELAKELGEWDPLDFVDQCQSASRDGKQEICREKQQLEWEHLFGYCYRNAIGA